MTKRLSAAAAKPRSRMRLPGYPTLAAAGMSLCLACGDGEDQEGRDWGDGGAAGLYDARFADARAQPALDGGDVDASVPNMAGGPTRSFDGGMDDDAGSGAGQ